MQPSRIPHRISKNLFALGSDKFLAMLEGKIRVTPFFKVQSGKITVWKAKIVYYLPKVAAQCKAVFFVVGVSMTDISIPALNSLAICSSLGIKKKEILLF